MHRFRFDDILFFNMKTILYVLFFMTLMNTVQAASFEIKALPLCANSPNCVSSQAKDNNHFIAPFNIIGDPGEAWNSLKKIISNQARTAIVEETEDSLHAEATSLVFRFIDDINAILDVNAKVIHIHSASRTGYSDFGVNRKRIEGLRLEMKEAKRIQ
jgi:uncharacterized protein (DUF1499 family)